MTGYGADAVNPYMAFVAIERLVREVPTASRLCSREGGAWRAEGGLSGKRGERRQVRVR